VHNAEILPAGSPTRRNDRHVRFVPLSVDGVPREIFRTTGTKEIAAAKRIGAQIIESPDPNI
jgi:hypothetical protein